MAELSPEIQQAIAALAMEAVDGLMPYFKKDMSTKDVEAVSDVIVKKLIVKTGQRANAAGQSQMLTKLVMAIAAIGNPDPRVLEICTKLRLELNSSTPTA